MDKSIVLFCSDNSFAQNFTFGGINYGITSSSTVEVANNSGFIGVANIPSIVSDGTTNYSVTSIGTLAFQLCSGLTSVSISNTVASIGQDAFAQCIGLTSITIPNSVTNIGINSFFGCSGLTSVSIPNSVISIAEGAFSNCNSLTSVGIPNSITSISPSTFAYCTSLTSITIPNSVTSIGVNSFFGCSSLTLVNIPSTVVNIEDSAFRDSGLTSVTIPNSVISIGDNTFYNCSGLASVTIPNSVLSIGQSAFYNCISLTSVNIPNSVTFIGDTAFTNCTSLGSVTVNWTTPLSINANVFTGLNLPTISLNVPTGTAGLYDATPVWTDFNIATLGINDFESEKIKLKIYPNPANSFLSIQNFENLTENFEYKIIDLTGRIVKNGNSKYNEQINIEELMNGNYIIKIQTDNDKIISQKIIKN